MDEEMVVLTQQKLGKSAFHYKTSTFIDQTGEYE